MVGGEEHFSVLETPKRFRHFLQHSMHIAAS